MKCPTCAQEVPHNLVGTMEARIATRPMAGPAQARHITRLEAELVKALAWINAKCTIAGCWKSKCKGQAG